MQRYEPGPEASPKSFFEGFIFILLLFQSNYFQLSRVIQLIDYMYAISYHIYIKINDVLALFCYTITARIVLAVSEAGICFLFG